MTHCPHCGTTEVFRGPNLMIHVLHVFSLSSKRYCYHCGEKWRMRSRSKRRGSYYLAAIFLSVLLSSVLFRFLGSDYKAASSNKPAEAKSSAASLLSLAAANKELLPLFADKTLRAKIQKYEKDPRALKKLSANQKLLAEQYAKKYGVNMDTVQK